MTVCDGTTASNALFIPCELNVDLDVNLKVQAQRAEPGVHIHNSKVINNQCSIPNFYNYFKAYYQYTICSFR